ncbi:hypothetical protein WG901_20770 [Novosphingobium sp. PS1R-30]|uniref:Acyl-protein synthetase LuxE domain-containing protein n=1 Tax=Novosphingobium anseongense TaxID=3133436 RepID=A0ABU8S1L1_9SPHN
MTEAVLDKPNLSPEAPDTWLDNGYEPLYAMSWRGYQDLQLQALKLHFAKVSGRVAALDKLAEREGITSIDSIEEGLPLLFDHRVLKNYPLSLIEKRDVGRLNAWLDRLTTHDLSKVDLTGVNTVDGWLDRLDAFGMLIGHSSGTTGKLSFVPRSQVEFPSWQKTYYEAQRATTGVDAYTDKVETFFPGYRGGHQMMMKMLELFNVPAAGGPEHYHTLYPHHISSDLLSLAARMQVAEDRGELDQLGLDPALLEARQALIAQGKRREQDIETWFFELFERNRGKRVKLGGSFGDLIKTARSGIAKGLKPDFAAGSFIMTGGGMKGLKDVPDDWEGYVRDYFGIDTIGMFYGMSEVMSMSPRCSCGNYHIMPHTIPLLFDREMNLLPREGTQTGRYAFYDLLPQTYWGGFISGDQLTINWDEDCACGWKGPRVLPEITRFAEMEGGDDKISCAGTQQAYNEFLDFVSGGE